MIDILLSAFNGEKYLSQQLDSILNQTYKEWKIIIRDDVSLDNTLNIINHYREKYPEKIILSSVKGKLGIVSSYSVLMKEADSDYIAFCDQDDIWLESKLEVFFSRMKSLEGLYPNTPIIVHSDMTIVDKNLNTLADSFWQSMYLDPEMKSYDFFLTSNNVTACAMMFNRHLRNSIGNIPKEAAMHDWWLGLYTSCFGVIDYIKQQTVLYRQHSNNIVGAKPIFNKIPSLLIRLNAIKRQADYFSDLYNYKKMTFFSLVIFKIYYTVFSYLKVRGDKTV